MKHRSITQYSKVQFENYNDIVWLLGGYNFEAGYYCSTSKSYSNVPGKVKNAKNETVQNFSKMALIVDYNGQELQLIEGDYIIKDFDNRLHLSHVGKLLDKLKELKQQAQKENKEF